jgi:hypothetical protein
MAKVLVAWCDDTNEELEGAVEYHGDYLHVLETQDGMTSGMLILSKTKRTVICLRNVWKVVVEG